MIFCRKEEIDMRYETPLLQPVARASETIQGCGPKGMDSPIDNGQQPFCLLPSNIEEL